MVKTSPDEFEMITVELSPFSERMSNVFVADVTAVSVAAPVYVPGRISRITGPHNPRLFKLVIAVWKVAKSGDAPPTVYVPSIPFGLYVPFSVSFAGAASFKPFG